jgi:ribosomal protein S18 acetylase RimI-like enzyme
MSEGLIVREARPSDYAAIADLTVAAYRTIDPDLGGYEARIRDVAGRAAVAIVLAAVLGGRVVGSATLVNDPTSPLAESDEPGDAAIRMLAVDPAAMGKGVGTALVRRCIELARDAGRRRMVLRTRTQMTAAHQLYRRFGFERLPELDEQVPGAQLHGYARQLENMTEEVENRP